MSDDWRGEHLILKRPSKVEQAQRGQSAIQTFVHKQRQAKGTNMSRSGGSWARYNKFLCIQACTKGRK